MEDSKKQNNATSALIKALLVGSRKSAYEKYRSAYKEGDALVPDLEEAILSHSSDKTNSGIQIYLLTGLMSLLHDIDETRSNEIAEKIIDRGCDRNLELRLRTIIKFTIDDFKKYSNSQPGIYISNKLFNHDLVNDAVRDWLDVLPKTHLTGLDRIYIVPRAEEENLGTYTPILCSVMVVWQAPLDLPYWMRHIVFMGTEFVFYHELGHHYHKHTFGQDPEQEKEADAYAKTMVHKNHPWLGRLASAIAQAKMTWVRRR